MSTDGAVRRLLCAWRVTRAALVVAGAVALLAGFGWLAVVSDPYQP
ncbi:hypothetical protein RKE29_02905 [Streptomyces sp. B1866]|nr:hypothetical protein [Streptomyces sp. B1866]MDT3395609.1 hypothetical protein [Streptomyces sp. B1866]